MVNHSKKRDPRFWNKWRKSGAVSLSTLPGAEAFYQYLCALFPGQCVVVTPPTVVDWSCGVEFTKVYDVRNTDRPETEHLPESTVSLIYDNGYFEAALWNSPEAPGRMVATPWQRQDGHDTILQFP